MTTERAISVKIPDSSVVQSDVEPSTPTIKKASSEKDLTSTLLKQLPKSEFEINGSSPLVGGVQLTNDDFGIKKGPRKSLSTSSFASQPNLHQTYTTSPRSISHSKAKSNIDLLTWTCPSETDFKPPELLMQRVASHESMNNLASGASVVVDEVVVTLGQDIYQLGLEGLFIA
jgi:hypothetical protein